MKQYLDLLDNIVKNGREKESGRSNMPNTFGLSRGTILMENVEENFPLLTTKKMYLKGIILELLWFLRGETNIKYLVDNNVNIWNGDAYRWYLKKRGEMSVTTDFFLSTQESFVQVIKEGSGIAHLDVREFDWFPNYRLGDLGKVYGYQWRNQNGVDQIKDIVDELKNNPYGRYKILDGWNKRDFPEMALPPCHLLYQFIVRPMTFEERRNLYPQNIPNLYSHEDLNVLNTPKYYLDLNMYQRSCDTLLGVPFNIASMSILLMIMAKVSNMVAGDAFWIGGDTHIYVDHISMVKEQLGREPYALPKLIIKKKLNTLDDILALTLEDFELLGYESHPAIKAELFTGLKK